MSQETFRSDHDYFAILHREVRSDGDLEKRLLTDKDDIQSIEFLLEDVLEKTDGRHKVGEGIDLNRYQQRWFDNVLNYSHDVSDGLSSGDNGPEELLEDVERDFEDIAENFKENMQTNALKEGKYVVFILTEGKILVCHSYTGEQALTTDIEIIEELLSTTNIDKYAQFTRNTSDELVVQHYDKWDTESFSNWLNLAKEEIVYDLKGDVRVYTEIDGLECVFEFDENEISSKILSSDQYDISHGRLVLPNEENKEIKRIQWGQQTFGDTSKFKSEILKINYKLSRTFNIYQQHCTENLEEFALDIQDRRDAVLLITSNEVQERIEKKVDPEEEFEVPFVNKHVSMHISWREKLASKTFGEGSPVPICHGGAAFTESPFEIGNLRIYSNLHLDESQRRYIRDLANTTQNFGSGNLQDLFAGILFRLLREASPSPISYLFGELSDEFGVRAQETIHDGMKVLQTEGNEIDLEFKAPEWSEYDDNRVEPEALAKKIHKEFQDCRLLVIGIDEGAKEFKALPKDRARTEYLEAVRTCLKDDFGVTGGHLWSFPIDGGYALLGLNVDVPKSQFHGNFDLLEGSAD